MPRAYANISRRCFLPTLAVIAIGATGLMAVSGAGSARAQNRRAISLEIRDGRVAVAEKTIRVNEGEEINIKWTTDAAVELHLHGYDIQALATPGQPVSMIFQAHTAGRFPISAHGRGHGHGTMIYLEVLPR
ncbi:MAG: hypothetical protein ISR50_03840 [Alphaproteobacteria bacterium]|nr:hypothetical protein [Alphaproteobacteria bacterium]